MPAYKTKAISIRNKPFAEADKLVTLFSREHGKIRVLAKGARRIPSRFGGRVETFSYADYFLAKGRSLDIVSQCEVLESFQVVRDDPAGLKAGFYFLRLIDASTAEGQPNPELFDLLLAGLWRLKEKTDAPRVVVEFEKAFLRIEGIFREGFDPKYCISDHVGRDIREW
ncbi:MAG: DNA repair protein RecO [Candidatus Margulisbacteria bacterium]|nr:DNA repair protein RecO [Candidatus Margulisiibacteriota bacterium]MBU1617777.1 DNA repair protein RecO [Candidatus Margulisiibacteriota bacterium]